MKHFIGDNQSATPPTVPGTTPTGYATEGDPGAATPASTVSEWWVHSITSEIVDAITDAGLTPAANDLTQLRQAIDAKVTTGLGTLGTASTKDVGTADGQIPLMDATGYPSADGSQITNIASNLPRGYIDGLTLSNGIDADHDINVSIGHARDSTNVANMALSSTLVKQIDAPWAVGSAAGGNDQAQLDGAQTVTFTDNGGADDFVTIDSGTWTVTPSVGDTLVVVGGTNAGSYQITAATTTQIDVATASFVADATSTSAIYTVKIDTWYHTWLIRRSDTGVVDMLFSESATVPTLPVNYDEKRRIGAVLTDATAHIVQFIQRQDQFYFDEPILDFTETNTDTAQIKTVSAPLGVATMAIGHLAATNSQAIYVSSPDVADMASSRTAAPLGSVDNNNSNGGGGRIDVWTDELSQLRFRGTGTSGNRRYASVGWIDPRGRNAA